MFCCSTHPQNKIAPSFEKSETLASNNGKIIKSFQITTPDIYKAITSENKLRVWVGTWNMHGQGPPDDLHLFITKPLTWEDDPKIYNHIIAISTQECEKTIEKSVLFPSKQLWESTLVSHLQNRYTLVKTETMAALHLAVFVINELKHFISDVESGFVATGIGNVIGNKGGVGIGFNFADSARFLFINSHLTAHQNKVKERNADFARICRELPLKGALATEGTDVTDSFEYTFWAGDLNYRVNGTRKMIDSLLSQNMMEVLLANDQLMIEREQGRVFQGFEEAPIKFRPTYKFNTLKKQQRRISQGSTITNDSDMSETDGEDDSSNGSLMAAIEVGKPKLVTRQKSVARKNSERINLSPTIPENQEAKSDQSVVDDLVRRESVYDSSKKQRIPSWTDRILYKSHISQIKALEYDACMSINTSDHKPVYGIYELDFAWEEVFKQDQTTTVPKRMKQCDIL